MVCQEGTVVLPSLSARISISAPLYDGQNRYLYERDLHTLQQQSIQSAPLGSSPTESAPHSTQVLLLCGSTPTALVAELGSTAEGLAEWVASAKLAEDGELEAVADTSNEV